MIREKLSGWKLKPTHPYNQFYFCPQNFDLDWASMATDDITLNTTRATVGLVATVARVGNQREWKQANETSVKTVELKF